MEGGGRGGEAGGELRWKSMRRGKKQFGSRTGMVKWEKLWIKRTYGRCRGGGEREICFPGPARAKLQLQLTVVAGFFF